MEPLSAAASIIAVIQITERIVCACKGYIEGVKDYPKDLLTVLREIRGVAGVFESLSYLKEDDVHDAVILSRLQGPDGPIESCKIAAEGLSSLLSTPAQEVSNSQGSKRRKLQLSLTTLAWPLKASQAQKLMNDIARNKTSINMALSGTIL